MSSAFGEAGVSTTAADGGAGCRLAAYGSLAPGRANQHQLDGLTGRWFTGYVRGDLVEAGWGVDLGFPGFIADPSGSEVPVEVFESSDLPANWSRLDEFEGPAYQRTVVTVHTENGPVEAFIYALST